MRGGRHDPQRHPCSAREMREAVEGGRAPRGFSLIELLVTAALLIVITTLYWGFASPSNQRRKQKACQDNLQKIYLALEIYRNDFQGQYPVTANARTSEEPLTLLVPHYSVDTGIFICPGSKDSALPAGEPFRDRKISYAFWMGLRGGGPRDALLSDRQVNAEPKSAGSPAFSENGKPPGNNHHQYGGNFVFCDGHAETTPARIPFSLVWTQGIVLLNPRP